MGADERDAGSGPEAAAGESLPVLLRGIVDAAAEATGADLVVARLLDRSTFEFAARAVAATSPARGAEAGGSRFPLAELPAAETDDPGSMPLVLSRLARRMRASAVLQIPVGNGDGTIATLELLRTGGVFDERSVQAARLAAGQIALAFRAYGADGALERGSDGLALAGEAFAAAVDEAPDEQLVRIAADAAGAVGARLWRFDEEGLVLSASWGAPTWGGGLSDEALEALEAPEGVAGGAAGGVAAVQVGKPPVALLELLASRTGGLEHNALAAFAARASHALRAGERRRAVEQELEQSRSLLTILGQAIAQLSLSHTLQIVVEHVRALLSVEHAAVYLREGGSLVAVAGHEIAGPHTVVGERLLALALGSSRARGLLAIEDTGADRRLRGVAAALEDAGIEAAIALPLVAHQEVIGLLAAYPARGRTVPEDEAVLLTALASQLAVAMQNARLHEQAKALGEELETALAAERETAGRLKALYEISRSFAQSLSLDTTMDAIAKAAVESLRVDAAVLRVPDLRGDAMITQAVHVADDRLADVVETMLSGAQILSRAALQRLFRRAEPLLLDAERALALGGSFALLTPFIERGSTVVVVPVATPDEVLATLTLLSLDPARPIEGATVDVALTLAAQAALAIENAQLYQAQKEFADTMQRSLLPRERPHFPGLDVGVVYESSERLDVGGDVYDFLPLDGSRLALVLGDVMGHGVSAAADMAMAKYIFRSLAREHPKPGDFLAFANEVVVGEFPTGKFLTLLYLTADLGAGEVACASAGHPQPLLVAPDGTVEPVRVTGLALGVEDGQTYEEVSVPFEPGASVVVYTDGVVEARSEGRLYGTERLEALLSRNARLGAQALAETVLEDSRKFGGGEFVDDCAIVVVRRDPA